LLFSLPTIIFNRYKSRFLVFDFQRLIISYFTTIYYLHKVFLYNINI
ncbi:hypothetical protein X975_00853, partial [Stegodyphus mimosarum]